MRDGGRRGERVKPPGPAVRSLALRLLERETGPRPGAEEVAAGAGAVCRKLSEHIQPLVGPTGFFTLLARALYLARPDFPLLDGVTSDASSESGLEGLATRARGREPDEVRAAVTAVFAHFLGLVAHFIGEDLTVRIVSRAWPDLPPGTPESAFEGDAA